MKKMKVTGQYDPEKETVPLKFHPKDVKLIDGVDLFWLGRH